MLSPLCNWEKQIGLLKSKGFTHVNAHKLTIHRVWGMQNSWTVQNRKCLSSGKRFMLIQSLDSDIYLSS